MSVSKLEQNDRDGKPRLLACLGAAWPGNDASGPNRSFAAFATAFAEEYDISLLARATPFGAAPSGRPDHSWFARDNYRVRYLAGTPLAVRGLLGALRGTAHDLVLLNGFFDREFTIPTLLARRLRLVPRRAVILSPRGEFFGGARGLKGGRKSIWLAFVRTTGLLRDVIIYATSDAERDAIIAADIGAKAIVVAPNISPSIVPPTRVQSENDVLRVIFVGRISPVKNLDLALSILAQVRTSVRFDVVGPEQDVDYAVRCRALAATLPPHVAVHWHGAISAEQVPDYLARADLLFLPSKSENFGHSIFEALRCGTPVLVGQETPWRGLADDGAGFDLPLDQPDKFADAIERVATFSRAERIAASAAARVRAERYLASSNAVARNRAMIRSALGLAQC